MLPPIPLSLPITVTYQHRLGRLKRDGSLFDVQIYGVTFMAGEVYFSDDDYIASPSRLFGMQSGLMAGSGDTPDAAIRSALKNNVEESNAN